MDAYIFLWIYGEFGDSESEKLEKAHPDSESIKYGFTVALMAA